MNFADRVGAIGKRMQEENATLKEALLEQAAVRFKEDALPNGVTRLVHNHAVNKTKLGVDILSMSKNTYIKRIAQVIEEGVIDEPYVFNRSHMFTQSQVHALMDHLGFDKYADNYESKVISIQNYKGGTGKSTTTISLAVKTALDLDLNARVLILDLDPQGSAARGIIQIEDEESEVFITLSDLLCAENELDGEVAHYLANGNSFEDIVLASPFSTHLPNLDVMTAFPTDEKFTDLYWELNDKDKRTEFLTRLSKKVLPILKERYDIIYLDLPPQNSPITWSALEAADMMLAPITPRTYDYMSTMSYMLTLSDIARSLPSKGENIEWVKILPVNFTERNKHEMKTYNRLLRTVGSDMIPKAISHSPLFLEVAEMNRSIFDILKTESTCTDIQFDEAISSVNSVYHTLINELKVIASKVKEE